MIAARIAKAVVALRAAGHRVDGVVGATNIYRVDGGDAVTGLAILALAIRRGLMDAPTGPR